ncbi:MAG TPA: PHB depolymerase family esterase [Gaiellaceae bacterium]|nr:PHB depolymerase family esterase [Gaiellaceae bacterium]
MRPRPYRILAAAAAGLLVPSPAHAASLSGPITGWASGVPSTISMYEYVPAKLAANPPVLVVSHYCGGTAAGVFGEAQGGGIVAAADQYGFLMVFPQTSNNCWDVGSTASLTHDGGGDTQAIAEMVKYAIARHSADPNRVYATGTSSGAMMTEALLAVYPDVFKAGAEFSGVPAGCWAVSYSASNQWSGPCASGQVTHTPQQWGSLVHAMYPAYSGYRPRVQLWHGEADTTINFNDQTEAIKEWSDVLGLTTTPTTADTVTFNNHMWTHQTWRDACGFTVLDAWSETNGPHGTDANLDAAYVIPFLGLDKAGPIDPEVAQCGDAGSPGSAGASDAGAGGAGDAAGRSSGGGGGGGTGSGGNSGDGGGAGSNGGAGSSGASGPSGTAGSNGAGTRGDAGGSASADDSPDASATSGGGAPGAPGSGCSCRASSTSGPEGGVVLVGLVVSSMAARRRRALARGGSRSNAELSVQRLRAARLRRGRGHGRARPGVALTTTR